VIAPGTVDSRHPPPLPLAWPSLDRRLYIKLPPGDALGRADRIFAQEFAVHDRIAQNRRPSISC